MSKAKQFSLCLSLISGAGISSVGLVPPPLVYLVGLLLMSLLVVATTYYGRWRWVPLGVGSARAAALGLGSVAAMSTALIFRGGEWIFVLIPLLSLAGTVGMFRWLTRHGRFVSSKGTDLA
ncbi:hypothetical protein J3D46_002159 [Paenarthrobacter sp. A20]|nr:hypothetical protein [Paenarthrobacter sp. A20]